MAKQFVEVLTSDFSGAQSDEVDTVQFALDGRAYEIELTPDEHTQLQEALKVYIAKSRKASAQVPAAVAKKSGGGAQRKKELAAMRKFLDLRGYDVPERGRIKAEWEQEWVNAGKPGLD